MLPKQNGNLNVGPMTSCAQNLLSRFSTFQQQQSTIVDNIVLENYRFD